jgi:hypothetical protein
MKISNKDGAKIKNILNSPLANWFAEGFVACSQTLFEAKWGVPYKLVYKHLEIITAHVNVSTLYIRTSKPFNRMMSDRNYINRPLYIKSPYQRLFKL